MEKILVRGERAAAVVFLAFAMSALVKDRTGEDYYWAVTALTTVGCGDIYPVSAVGRLVSMVSSLFGIAVIALPAGIVTAGFMEEMSRDEAEREAATVLIVGLNMKRDEKLVVRNVWWVLPAAGYHRRAACFLPILMVNDHGSHCDSGISPPPGPSQIRPGRDGGRIEW